MYDIATSSVSERALCQCGGARKIKINIDRDGWLPRSFNEV